MKRILWMAVLALLAAGACRLSSPADQPSPTAAPSLPPPAPTPSPAQATQTPIPTSASDILATPVAPSATPAASATSTSTSTRSPTPGMPIPGIESSDITSPTNLNLIAGAGAAWTRFSVLEWDQIEPQKATPPQYHWEAANESGMRLAKAAGLQLIAVVKFAPAWAQKTPGEACGAISPEAVERFALFVTEAVRRYSQPPYSVKYWEIGNEVDVSPQVVPPHNPYGCWGDSADAYYGGGYYAEVLKAIYPEIKQADPQAQVLVGGLLMDCDPLSPPKGKDCASSLFFEGILKNSGGGYFDGVSFHAYDYYMGSQYGHPGWNTDSTTGGPSFVRKAAYLNELLQRYNHPEKYLVLSEVALLCGGSGDEPYCKTDDYFRTKRAYISQVMALAQAGGLRAAVWYSLEGWRASGLKQDSQDSQSAYRAFQFSAALLDGAAWVGERELYPQVKILEFVKNNQRYWVMWSQKENGVTIDLPKTPAVIYNALGEELPVNTSLALNFETIYIKWKD